MSSLPTQEIEKLESLKQKILLEDGEIKYQWYNAILHYRSFLYNMYLNVVSGDYQLENGDLDFPKMILDPQSNLRIKQRNTLFDIVQDLGLKGTKDLMQRFFFIHQGVLRMRSFVLDEIYLEKKKEEYERHFNPNKISRFKLQLIEVAYEKKG